jgi:hypothetical protein
MITKKTSDNKTLMLYASIKEMPIKLYNLTQRYLLQDMGIGSDMASIDDHFKSLDAFLAGGKLDDAKLERENMRFNFYTMLEQVNYKSLAFACHIFSVDGIEVTDRSEEALTELANSLSVSLTDIEEVLSEVKKNFNTN